MNIPFPTITPRLVDPKWFNADSPCDEESEITNMEQKQAAWKSRISQKFLEMVPIGRTAPEPMEEEAQTDEEEGNEETDDTEESYDDDEEEDLRGSVASPTAVAQPANPPATTPNNNDQTLDATTNTISPTL